MSIIKVPGGGVHFMVGGSDDAAEVQALINARHEFGMAYCRKQGWPENPEKLSIAQIMEIRSQPGWKAGGAL